MKQPMNQATKQPINQATKPKLVTYKVSLTTNQASQPDSQPKPATTRRSHILPMPATYTASAMLIRANGITTASSANVVQYWSKPTEDAGDSEEEDSNLAPVVEGHAANAGTTQSGILAVKYLESLPLVKA
mgnify:CR=1 FL=1